MCATTSVWRKGKQKKIHTLHHEEPVENSGTCNKEERLVKSDNHRTNRWKDGQGKVTHGILDGLEQMESRIGFRINNKKTEKTY